MIFLEIFNYQNNKNKIKIINKLVTLNNLSKYKIFSFKDLKNYKKQNPQIKYVLFENFIIDVTEFSTIHPGGNNLIDSNLFTDIGRYITGTQAFSNDIKSYDHSSQTFIYIIEKLIIGILDENHNYIKQLGTDYNKSSRMSINQNDLSENENKKLVTKNTDSEFYFFEENMNFIEKNNIAEDTDQIVFYSENYKFAKFLSGIKWMGRHMSVNSDKLNKTRYYSICLCLSPYMKDKMNLILNNLKSLENNINIRKSLIQTETEKENFSNNFYVYLKKYDFKNCLSKEIHEMKHDDKILIRGPLVNINFFLYI